MEHQVFMMSFFINLLAGHFVGDFVLQSRTMAQEKRRWLVRIRHALIVTAASGMFLGSFSWHAAWLLLLLVVSHFIIDSAKCWYRRDDVYAFLFDQAAHVAVLAIISRHYVGVGLRCVWVDRIPGYTNGMVILVGSVLSIWFGSVLIAKAVAPLTKELDDSLSQGLTNGGRWIGQLERALIYLLVLSGNTGTIGFLLAAKSILRFGEIKESSQRKEAEYIIIGTLMSFGWALIVGIITCRILPISMSK